MIYLLPQNKVEQNKQNTVNKSMFTYTQSLTCSYSIPHFLTILKDHFFKFLRFSLHLRAPCGDPNFYIYENLLNGLERCGVTGNCSKY